MKQCLFESPLCLVLPNLSQQDLCVQVQVFRCVWYFSFLSRQPRLCVMTDTTANVGGPAQCTPVPRLITGDWSDTTWLCVWTQGPQGMGVSLSVPHVCHVLKRLPVILLLSKTAVTNGRGDRESYFMGTRLCQKYVCLFSPFTARLLDARTFQLNETELKANKKMKF